MNFNQLIKLGMLHSLRPGFKEKLYKHQAKLLNIPIVERTDEYLAKRLKADKISDEARALIRGGVPMFHPDAGILHAKLKANVLERLNISPAKTKIIRPDILSHELDEGKFYNRAKPLWQTHAPQAILEESNRIATAQMDPVTVDVFKKLRDKSGITKALHQMGYAYGKQPIAEHGKAYNKLLQKIIGKLRV